MRLFTVYWNPSDYPGCYVVREWVTVDGKPMPAVVPHAVTSDLDSARQTIPAWAVRLARGVDDDPVIVETWI
jgi:hypothetical protein